MKLFMKLYCISQNKWCHSLIIIIWYWMFKFLCTVQWIVGPFIWERLIFYFIMIACKKYVRILAGLYNTMDWNISNSPLSTSILHMKNCIDVLISKKYSIPVNSLPIRYLFNFMISHSTVANSPQYQWLYL